MFEIIEVFPICRICLDKFVGFDGQKRPQAILMPILRKKFFAKSSIKSTGYKNFRAGAILAQAMQ